MTLTSFILVSRQIARVHDHARSVNEVLLHTHQNKRLIVHVLNDTIDIYYL